jgi:hypothetical protein
MELYGSVKTFSLILLVKVEKYWDILLKNGYKVRPFVDHIHPDDKKMDY